ncbi:YciI family protein [Nocardioides cynanchi]|uniref:YciI family protein n=1 Tax=Nocardioides cynanchi TaxID=2558918 RepID=UPI00124646C3|nr:YciI family protein [Nocardioides cynanchi]
MKYLMLHSVDHGSSPEAEARATPEALDAWITEMTARGLLLDGSKLQPISDATTVRAPEGRTVVTDGPFAETKEQVAGYDVIDCPDLDSAVAVAAAHPTTHIGSIEVRAFAPGMPDPVVPAAPAPGKYRYLMLVCADLRRAMAAAAADPEGFAADRERETTAGAGVEETNDDVDVWIENAGSRRLYGWELEFPDRAVTVRRVDDRVVTTDGPFAETKEQIAGYDLLECDDLDDAIAIATSHPVAGGGVLELRPLRAS